MKKPDYYRLEPVYPPEGLSIVNAACGVCQLCGEIATGYGASERDVCLKCGNLLKSGRLRGIVKHKENQR